MNDNTHYITLNLVFLCKDEIFKFISNRISDRLEYKIISTGVFLMTVQHFNIYRIYYKLKH